ncbi:hypothetical protein OH77DRAFT_1513638 [Trametes cingulata]|nr:hypothetical protein OH77DRAFT_1513638 [Trametes cingulata]
MSYFCSGDRLVQHMWPQYLSAHMDTLLDKAELAQWAVVPDTYDGICDWAIAMPLEEGRPNESTLLYAGEDTPSAEGKPVRVCVVVHGVVESVNLRALGNYKGRINAAQRAVQYITLASGGWQDAFHAQVHTLGRLREYLGVVFKSTVHDPAHTPGTIHFSRPVFTPRVPRTDERQARTGASSVLRLGDDPEGLAEAIKRHWVVGHRVRTGIAKTGKAAATCIREGDFVAVAASVDIIKTQRGREWRTEMRLSVREVSRIMSAEELRSHSPAAAVTSPSVKGGASRSRPLELTVLGVEEDTSGDEGDIVMH